MYEFTGETFKTWMRNQTSCYCKNRQVLLPVVSTTHPPQWVQPWHYIQRLFVHWLFLRSHRQSRGNQTSSLWAPLPQIVVARNVVQQSGALSPARQKHLLQPAHRSKCSCALVIRAPPTQSAYDGQLLNTGSVDLARTTVNLNTDFAELGKTTLEDNNSCFDSLREFTLFHSCCSEGW